VAESHALHDQLEQLIQSGEQTMANWDEMESTIKEEALSVDEKMNEYGKEDDIHPVHKQAVVETEVPALTETGDEMKEIDTDYDSIFGVDQPEEPKATSEQQPPEVIDQIEEAKQRKMEKQAAIDRAYKKARNFAKARKNAKSFNDGLGLAVKMMGRHAVQKFTGSKDIYVSVPKNQPHVMSKAEAKEAKKEEMKDGLDLAHKLLTVPHSNVGKFVWGGAYSKPRSAHTEAKKPKAVDTMHGQVNPNHQSHHKEHAVALPKVNVASVTARDEVQPIAESEPLLADGAAAVDTMMASKFAARAVAVKKAAKEAPAQAEMKKEASWSNKEWSKDLHQRVINNPVFREAKEDGAFEKKPDTEEEEEDDPNGAFESMMNSAGLGHYVPTRDPFSKALDAMQRDE
jgi:hypothetical protein